MKFADTFIAGNTLIEIVFDDITNANTEVIVNSVCNNIHIGRGVSGAIKEKGGKIIYDELHNYSGRFIEGEIYLSSAGKLPFKNIYHAISSNCYAGTNAEILKSCVKNTLKIAREKEIKSIGFPAFGTGDMNFSINDAAEILINTVIDDCIRNTGLERIVFYLYRPDIFTTFFRKTVKATLQNQQLNKKGENKLSDDLGNCEIGLDHQLKYENIVANILKTIFVPPLSNYMQIKRQNGYLFTDLIFPNYSNEGFWNIIDRRYDVKNVIVTCYNQNILKIDEIINPLNDYFKKGNYGKFGVLLCRENSKLPELKKAIYLSHKNYNGVILTIDDFDISQLKELKKTKYEPENYLQRKISEYLIEMNEFDQNYYSNIFEEAKDFLIKSEIQNALNLLQEFYKMNKKINNSIIQLLSRNSINDQNYYIRGILEYDDYKLEYNKIVNATLSIISNNEKN